MACDRVTISVIEKPAARRARSASGPASRGWKTMRCAWANAAVSLGPSAAACSGSGAQVGPSRSSGRSLSDGKWPYGPSAAPETLGLLAFTLVAFLLGVLPLQDILLLLRRIRDLARSRFRARTCARSAELSEAAATAR